MNKKTLINKMLYEFDKLSKRLYRKSLLRFNLVFKSCERVHKSGNYCVKVECIDQQTMKIHEFYLFYEKRIGFHEKSIYNYIQEKIVNKELYENE